MEGIAFKAPSNVPQDLQIIQDLIGDLIYIPSSSKPPTQAAEIQNVGKTLMADRDSDSDADSEREVEADILVGLDDEAEDPSVYVQSSQVPI